MHESNSNQIMTLIEDPKAIKVEKVQSLWSDYGEIARYYSPKLSQSFIAKIINLAKTAQDESHPRGWNTSTSHKRKLSSYYNELNFYKHYAAVTAQPWLRCCVPQLINAKKTDSMLCLLMHDLDAMGYANRLMDGNIQTAKACLSWLAHFHACFLQQNLSEVWKIGSYWHLDTRPDEWAKMPLSQLKESAFDIDCTLNNAQYQTLIHGDAKIANFCFDKHYQQVAAVDFQYTGRGAGIKDVVYFLGSCFSSHDLYLHADTLLDYYFVELGKCLGAANNKCRFAELESEWRKLYCFAWADFERFLRGWSPQHKKLNDYSEMQTAKALNMLTQI